ncbi:MAG TPA: hypothetical protein VE270_02365, partial [Thermoleophilaceae bacterium]|nr:hypothetical protein [Thermoleophilaceae bacterium]
MLYVVPLSAPTAPRARRRAGAPAPAASPDARSPRRDILIACVHLGVLSAFACAQPLFDLLGRTPEFFATRGSGAGEIIALGLTLVLVPPALLVGIELIGGLIDRRVRRGLHLAFVSALVALLALQAIQGVAEGGGLALVALALVLGAAGALAYARAPVVRSF